MANWLQKLAQFTNDPLSDTVYIPSNWKEFLICEIRSTIQHEARHRYQKETGRELDPVSSLESDAEGSEETCLRPDEIGSWVEVSKSELFNSALGSSNVPPQYKQDVRTVALPKDLGAVGLFQFSKNPNLLELDRSESGVPNVYDSPIDRMMYIDVSGIIGQFLPYGYRPPQGQSNIPGEDDYIGVTNPYGGSNQTVDPVDVGEGISGREGVGGWEAR